MKKLFLALILFFPAFSSLFSPTSVRAAETPGEQGGFINYLSGCMAIQLTGAKSDGGEQFAEISQKSPQNVGKYLCGPLDENGNRSGLLDHGSAIIAELYQQQPSGREYVADLLDNIGVPTVSRAYAQGTGYKAMSPFLVFWKVFRNLAYSLYIIMFMVVGIMIMLRTKVSAQAVITIQAALPNLLITLLLITFSYAIVGFMIDLMYFLIYFIVYLFNSVDIIDSPLKAIDRLLSYSAWSVIFEGRNTIISAVSVAIDDLLAGLGTGALNVAGHVLSWISPTYLMVAIWMGIAMIKLMVALVKSYVMLIVQVVTAPLQILMNALPGSKAFGDWLKKTASYLIPFPVAAAMFIFAAILVGDPTKTTIIHGSGDRTTDNFGINANHEFYTGYDGYWSNKGINIWLPPFTLTGATDLNTQDILTLIGFFVFTMTPAAVKMAQDWLQVKESPYTAEAFAGFGGALALGKTAFGWKTSLQHNREATQQLTTQKQMAATLEKIAKKP